MSSYRQGRISLIPSGLYAQSSCIYPYSNVIIGLILPWTAIILIPIGEFFPIFRIHPYSNDIIKVILN